MTTHQPASPRQRYSTHQPASPGQKKQQQLTSQRDHVKGHAQSRDHPNRIPTSAHEPSYETQLACVPLPKVLQDLRDASDDGHHGWSTPKGDERLREEGGALGVML